jgi:hypothetical protein
VESCDGTRAAPAEPAVIVHDEEEERAEDKQTCLDRRSVLIDGREGTAYGW